MVLSGYQKMLIETEPLKVIFFHKTDGEMFEIAEVELHHLLRLLHCLDLYICSVTY